MRSNLRIAILYAIFAIVAIVVNLSTQVAVFALLGEQFPFVLIIALGVGTGVALVVKYFLDQRWVFTQPTRVISDHAKLFVGYSMTGAVTTALFWSIEIAFDLLTEEAWYRYLGGAIGITLAYMLKYWLDRRYVFCGSEEDGV